MPLPSGNLVTPVGQRSDGLLRSILIDDNDRIVVADNLNSFSESFHETKGNPVTGAGTVQLSGTAVPAGEIWHVLSSGIVNGVSGYTRGYITVNDGTNDHHVLVKATPTANNWDILNYHLVLTEGYFMKATFQGCTAGDSVTLSYYGYKTLIA